MTKSAKDLILLTFLVVALTFLVWLPHLLSLSDFWGLNFNQGFNIIYRNFDGLEYIVIAKSLYKPELISAIPNALNPTYYASHFPGYSLLIIIFASLLGYLKSMLFVSVASTILAAWAFYFLVRDFKLTSSPLFLTFLFLILPARWLIVHSVGSSEPLFIFLTISALYYFLKYEHGQFIYLHLKNPPKIKKYLFLASLFATLAQITRPPGILLFIALAVYIHYKMFNSIKGAGIKKAFLNHLNYYPLIIIPLSLVAIFYHYGVAYKDFFAYFHSGDNIHLTLPPFSVFNKAQPWVGDIWLEDIVYIFTLSFLGISILFKKRLYPLAFFATTYLLASIFVAHRDISRYILPITPFLIISFEKVLTSKEFKIITPIIFVAIYLYSQNFIIHNTAPIPSLLPYN